MMRSVVLSQLWQGQQFETESLHFEFERHGHLPGRDGLMKYLYWVHYGNRRITRFWSVIPTTDR